MWYIVKEVAFNVFGAGICILAICWAQHKLFELAEDFMPNPSKWAKSKTDSAYKFYKGNKSYEKDKALKPNRQGEECNKYDYSHNYYEPPVGLFSSTWTHFTLLLQRLWTHHNIVPNRKATIVLYQKKILCWLNSEVSRIEFYVFFAIFVIIIVIIVTQFLELDRVMVELENSTIGIVGDGILPFGYEENMRWLDFDKTIGK